MNGQTSPELHKGDVIHEPGKVLQPRAPWGCGNAGGDGAHPNPQLVQGFLSSCWARPWATRLPNRSWRHRNVVVGGGMEWGRPNPRWAQTLLGEHQDQVWKSNSSCREGKSQKGSRKVDFVNAFQSPRGIQPISGPRHLPPHRAVGCSWHSRIPTEQMILTGGRSQPSPAPAAPARGWQGFCQCHCLFGAARLGFRCFWHDSAAGPCSLALHPSRCKSSQVGEGRQGMRTEPGMP